eukprot:m.110471 g.110471  ORF g.110471 m.110471 type:complete len:1895 (+) comp37396_c0_seq1:90-5774(+)
MTGTGKGKKRKAKEGSSPDAKRKPIQLQIEEFSTLVQCESTVLQGLVCFNKYACDEESGAAFVENYVAFSSECKDLMQLLQQDKLPSQQPRLLFKALEAILLHAAAERDQQALGMKMSRRIIHGHLKMIYQGLGRSSSNGLVKATLKLLGSVVMQSSAVARELQLLFDFSLPSLPFLPNKRNRQEEEDVRSCFIKFCLAFLVSGDATVVSAALENKVLLSAALKGLFDDSMATVHLVLSILDKYVLEKKSVSKKTKVLFFSSQCLSYLVKLYQRTEEQLEIVGSDGSSIPMDFRDYLHKFLLKLCCSPDKGLAFVIRSPVLFKKTSNPVLLHFLAGIRCPWIDPLVLDLVIQTLTVCPDLVSHYLTQSFTMEPRKSDSWFSTINFLLKLLDNVKGHTSLICAQPDYDPRQLVPHVIGLVCPSIASRQVLSVGVQHKEISIRYAICCFMSVIMKKSLEVIDSCCQVSNHNARWGDIKDDSSGDTFLGAFRVELEKVLPDVNLILSVRHKAAISLNLSEEDIDFVIPELTPDLHVNSLVYYQKVLEVMGGYVSLMPSSFLRSGYDLAKLLRHPQGDCTTRGYLLSLPIELQCSLLGILSHSPMGVCQWFQVGAESSLLAVLEAMAAEGALVNQVAKELLHKVLFESGLFQHSRLESVLFVESVQSCVHFHHTSPLLIPWINDVIALSAKDPYSAIEEIHSLKASDHQPNARRDELKLASITETENLDECLSYDDEPNNGSIDLPFGPLVITFLQQYSKVAGQNLGGEPRFKIALCSFLSVLLSRLLHVQTDPGCLVHAVRKYLASLELEQYQHNYIVGYVLAWANRNVEVTGTYQDDLEESRAKLEELFSSRRPKSDEKVVKLGERLQEVLASIPSRLCAENTERIVAFCDSHLRGKYDSLVYFLKSRPGLGLPSCVQSILLSFPCWLHLTTTSALFDEDSHSLLGFIPDEANEVKLLDQIPHLRPLELEEICRISLSRLSLLMRNNSEDADGFSWKAVSFFLSLIRSCLGRLNGPCTVSLMHQVYPQLSIYSQALACANSKKQKRKRRRTSDASDQYTLKCLGDVCVLVRLAVSELPLLNTTIQTLAAELLDQITKRGCFNGEMIVNLMHCLKEVDIPSAVKKMFTFQSSDCIDEEYYEGLVSLYSKSSEKLRKDVLQALLDLLAETHNEAVGTALAKLLTVASEPLTLPWDASLSHLLSHPSPIGVKVCAAFLKSDQQLARRFVEGRLLQADEQNRESFLPVVVAVLGHLLPPLEKKESKFVKRAVDLYWELIAGKLSQERKEAEIWYDLLCKLLCLMTSKSHGKKNCCKLLSVLCACTSWSLYQLRSAEALACWLLEKGIADDAVVLFGNACLKLCCAALNQVEDQLASEDEIEAVTSRWTLKLAQYKDLELDCSLLIPAWNDFAESALCSRLSSVAVLTVISSMAPFLYSDTEDHDGGIISPVLLYQTIIAQPQLHTLLLESGEDGGIRSSLIQVLCSLMRCCSALRTLESVPLLLLAYRPYLCPESSSLLVLLRQFEKEGVRLSSLSPYLWGRAALEQKDLLSIGPTSLYFKPGPENVLDLLDGSVLFNTAFNFPLELKLEPSLWSEESEVQQDSSMYDPRFLLPLFVELLQPALSVDCRRVVERGVLALALSSLSSYDIHMRAVGYLALAEFLSQLEGARFREKPQIQLLLRNLVNAVTKANMRIPWLLACFAAKATSVLLKPDHKVYTMLNRFLLQRPVLELNDVPLFYELFNSSSLEHKAERLWMLHLLCDGLREYADYRIYQKRHVVEMVISHHDSQLSDTGSQELALKLVLRVLSIQKAVLDLMLHRGILSWLHGLILSLKSGHESKLRKILDLLRMMICCLVGNGRERRSLLKECSMCCLSATLLGSPGSPCRKEAEELLKMCNA